MDETSITNLRILIGKHGGNYGSPASGFFAKQVGIDEKEMSNILCNKSTLSPYSIRKIEDALSLPKGWLREDISFLFQSNPQEINLYRQIACLSSEKQEVLTQLVKLL